MKGNVLLYTNILGTAAKCGCAAVLSEDLPDGQTYGFVTTLNPFLDRAVPNIFTGM